MAFLDGTSITVDAALTKKGRELLKTGKGLDIVAFTLSDTGVDYTLWNPDQPTGSAYYGETIENTPQLEANVHSVYSLRDRLVTLPQNTITMPALEIQLPRTSTSTLTFNDENATLASVVTVNLKGYASTGNGSHTLYVIMESPSVASLTGKSTAAVKELSGIVGQYSRESGIQSALMYSVGSSQTSPVQWTFGVSPKTTDRQSGLSTNVTVIDAVTGVYNTFSIVNNITRLTRSMLGSGTSIG